MNKTFNDAAVGSTLVGASHDDATPCKALHYRTSSGEKKQVPVCTMCVDAFRIEPERREVLEKCLAVHMLLEWDDIQVWHDLSGTYGRSDYLGSQAVQCVSSQVEKAEGLYDLSLEDISALWGSMHIALAAGAFGPDERSAASNIISWLGEFRQHLGLRHRERDGCGIDRETLQQADKPRYVGNITLEVACRLQPDLAGLTITQMTDKLAQVRHDSRKYYREHASTAHGGKPDRVTMLRTALWNAVETVKARATEWRQGVANAQESWEVWGVSSTLHEQVFLIDELLGQGVWDGALSCNGSVSLYEAIEGVKDLIDWNECSHLGQFMDRYRAAATSKAGLDVMEW